MYDPVYIPEFLESGLLQDTCIFIPFNKEFSLCMEIQYYSLDLHIIIEIKKRAMKHFCACSLNHIWPHQNGVFRDEVDG